MPRTGEPGIDGIGIDCSESTYLSSIHVYNFTGLQKTIPHFCERDWNHGFSRNGREFLGSCSWPGLPKKHPSSLFVESFHDDDICWKIETSLLLVASYSSSSNELLKPRFALGNFLDHLTTSDGFKDVLVDMRRYVYLFLKMLHHKLIWRRVMKK